MKGLTGWEIGVRDRTGSGSGTCVLWVKYSWAEGDGAHRVGIWTWLVFIRRGRLRGVGGVVVLVMVVAMCMMGGL